MQGTPGRDVRTYAGIQKYLQSDYSASSASRNGVPSEDQDPSNSTMSRVLARLNRSQGSVDGTGVLLSETKPSPRGRRMSATAEYTDLLQQQRTTQPQSDVGVSNQSQAVVAKLDAESALRKYKVKPSGGGNGGSHDFSSSERLVKSGVLKDLRGKLAHTEQKLRVVQADFVTKSDEVRKLMAKVSRLEKEKSAALQSQIDSLPKSSKRKAKASIWGKLELDTKKRDARFSQILQHYEILEGQYNEAVKSRDGLEEDLSQAREYVHRKELENASLREELTSMTFGEQRNRLEFLECMKSLQEVKRSQESSQESCRQLKEVVDKQEETIARQSDEISKLKKLQERTLKEKVKKDRRVGGLQKKIQKQAEEIDVLKKTQESYESDYYNLEDRMKVLRKRNNFLETNLDKANRTTDDARKTVEMKEQECKLMAELINESRRTRSSVSSTSKSNTSFAPPQFTFPAQQQQYGSNKEETATMHASSPKGGKEREPVSPVNLFSGSKRGGTAAASGLGATTSVGGAPRFSDLKLSIEDELADLVCSPDSLDGDEYEEEGEG